MIEIELIFPLHKWKYLEVKIYLSLQAQSI